VLKVLLEMQLKGGQGFDPAWCSQTGRYDQEMILEYESGYFIRSFVRDYCGAASLPRGLQAELRELAARAARAGPLLFLHRDFQSRNILLQGGKVRIIDFQAGRLGPPGYDLASLLIDPYVGLEENERRELFEHYLGLALDRGAFEDKGFRQDYPFLVLHRRLQMLGAFAFLSRKKGRPGFEGFLPPVLDSLKKSLTMTPLDGCTALKRLVMGLKLEEA
jgi:aminoglycoside/choline kinase family phosphotransferase